jgi:hypothetical protein
MPTATLKNGLRFVDPGGDPASPGLHGQVSSGGFVEFNGIIVTTQATGWRQVLITRGAAT